MINDHRELPAATHPALSRSETGGMNRLWLWTAPAGHLLDDVLEPSYWAKLAGAMVPGDRIAVTLGLGCATVQFADLGVVYVARAPAPRVHVTVLCEKKARPSIAAVTDAAQEPKDAA